jgi:hypothetical protein
MLSIFPFFLCYNFLVPLMSRIRLAAMGSDCLKTTSRGGFGLLEGVLDPNRRESQPLSEGIEAGVGEWRPITSMLY